LIAGQENRPCCPQHYHDVILSEAKNLGSLWIDAANGKNQRCFASLNMTKVRILDFGFPTLD